MRGRTAAVVVAVLAGGAALWFLRSPSGSPIPTRSAPVAAPAPPVAPGAAAPVAAEPEAATPARPERWTGTCVLRGRATRPDGTPWTGVIALDDRYGDEDEPPPTARTAADGTFRFERLPRMQVRLLAREADGRALPGPRVLLPIDDEVPFVVGGGLAEFEGRVVADSDGAAVAGAAIQVRLWSTGGLILDRAVSDADGRFRARATVDEDCEALVEAAGFLGDAMRIDADRRPAATSAEVRLRRTGAVEVRVVEDGTGRPVPGVVVRFEHGYGRDDSILRTDASGRCAREGLRPGRVVVVAIGGGWVSRELAAREGWDPVASAIEIPDGGVLRHEIVVVRAPRIRGRVLDARGLAVGGVRVRGWTGGGPRSFLRGIEPLGEARTDDQGAFEFPDAVPGVESRLSVWSEKWPMASAAVPPILPGEIAQVTLQLPEPRSVEVRVVDGATGAPVPDADLSVAIRLHEENTWHFPGPNTSGGGTAIVGPLPAQPVAISVQSVLRRLEGATVEVGPEDRGPVELRVRVLAETPRDLSIEGVATMPDGSPAAGADWECWERGERSLRCFAAATLTDSRGRFRAEGLAPGPHRMTVSLRRGGREFHGEADFQAGTRDAVVRLVDEDLREAGLLDASPIRIRVVGPDDAPVAGGAVSVAFVSEDIESCVSARLHEGACGFVPEDGANTMWIDVLDPVDASGAPLPLAHGRFGPFPVAPGEMVLRLRPELAIAGRVVDAEGRGVPEVRVEVQIDAASDPGGDRWSSPNESAQTGPDGRFRIGRLGDFVYSIEFEPGPRFVMPPPRRVRGGAERVVEELRPAVSAAITVLDPEGRPVASANARAWPWSGRGAHGRTHSAGEVRLAGLDPEADHTLEVRPPDGREDLLPIEIGAWRPVDTTVRLERGYPFRVLVRDRAGGPLEGIGVWIVRKVEGAESEDRETDAKGAAQFAALPAGPVLIGATLPGPGGSSRTLATVDANAEQGLAEIVVDIGGEAVLRVKGWDPGLFGSASFALGDDPEPTEVAIRDDGTVRLQGLAPGREYNVYLGAGGPTEQDDHDCALLSGVRAGDPPREIELVEGKDITGRVILPEGADGFAVAALVGKTVMIDGYALTKDTFRIPAVPEGTWTVVVYLTTEDGKYHAATGTAAAGGSVEIRVP